ncbi:MAG: hypothetical protein WBF58_05970 [Xanthobacteraceae bacterium]
MPQYQASSRNGGHTLGRITPVTCTIGRTIGRTLGGAVLAALAVCAGTAAAHAGSDTENTAPSFYDQIMQTIGLGSNPSPDYSERSPLVVPPTRALPPPMADRAPAVPDWPKDPDMTARKKAKAKEKPHPHADYVTESSRPLRPDELRVPGPFSGSSGGGTPVDPEAQSLNPAVTQPGKKGLFSFDFLSPNKSEYATFTGEPTRTSLTDPPVGYLTPSPDQPYGIGPEQRKYKVPTVGDRETLNSGSAGSQQ